MLLLWLNKGKRDKIRKVMPIQADCDEAHNLSLHLRISVQISSMTYCLSNIFILFWKEY